MRDPAPGLLRAGLIIHTHKTDADLRVGVAEDGKKSQGFFIKTSIKKTFSLRIYRLNIPDFPGRLSGQAISVFFVGLGPQETLYGVRVILQVLINRSRCLEIARQLEMPNRLLFIF